MTETGANAQAFERLCASDPNLTAVAPAGSVLPGMTHDTILTSGPPLAWDQYTGSQREAIIGGALFEGLAETRAQAKAQLATGRIRVAGCCEHQPFARSPPSIPPPCRCSDVASACI